MVMSELIRSDCYRDPTKEFSTNCWKMSVLKKIRPVIVTMLLISCIVQSMFQFWESGVLS